MADGKGLAHNTQNTRPAPKAMPRDAMLAELGDVEVDANTIAEIDELRLRSGEPDENGSIEQIVNREAIKFEGKAKQEMPKGLPPVQNDPDPEDEDGEPEDDEEAGAPQRTSLEEQIRIHKAQMDAQVETIQRGFEQALQNAPQFNRQQEPVKAKSEEVPEYMRYTDEQIQAHMLEDPYNAQLIIHQREIYTLKKQNQEIVEQQARRDRNIIASKFDTAYATAKTSLPEFDKYITPDLMKQAREVALQSRNTEADLGTWMRNIYLVHAGPDLLAGKIRPAVAGQSADDLAAKRQAKIKATSSLSRGGTAYQPPERKNEDKSIRGGRDGFLSDLKAMGID